MKIAKSTFKEFLRNEDGSPAVEFAITGILVIVCWPALVDLSTMIDSAMKLSSGVRAGEQYAMKYSSDSSGITQAVVSGSGLDASKLTISTSQFCECNGSSHSCSSSCSGGFNLAKYTQITASYNLSGQYNYPALNYPSSITRYGSVRTQ